MTYRINAYIDIYTSFRSNSAIFRLGRPLNSSSSLLSSPSPPHPLPFPWPLPAVWHSHKEIKESIHEEEREWALEEGPLERGMVLQEG